MSKFKDWWKRVVIGEIPKAETAVLTGMKVQPIVINPTDTQRLEIAAYRLDAIRRYIEQTPEISRQKMREFFTETAAHAALLLNAEKITPEEHDAAIALVTVK